MAKRINRKGTANQQPAISVKQLLQIGILICVIFGLFYFRSYFTVNNMKGLLLDFQGAFRGGGGSQVQEFTFIGDSRNQYLSYRDRLVVAGIDGVSIFDQRRSSQATIPLSYAKPVAKSGSKYLLCYDAGGTELTLIRDTEVEETLTTEGTLLTAAVNNSGMFATVTTETGYKGMVTVYNNSRKGFYMLHSKESVLDLEISPLSDSMSMITLDTKDGKLVSKLTAYDLGQEEPIGSFAKEGSLFLDVYYKDTGLVSVMSEGALYFFGGKAQEKGSYDFEGRYVLHYDMTPQRYSVVALSENQTGTENTIRAIDNNGQVQGEYVIQEEVLDLCANETGICVLTGTQLLVLNNKCELQKTVPLNHAEAEKIVLHKNGVFVIGSTWAKSINIS